MDRTEFDRLFGTEQGRLSDPAGFTPPEGRFLFVLGSDVPGRLARVVPGDHAEVFQTGDFGAGQVLRTRMRIRAPLVPPGGDRQWVAQMRVDDVVVTSRVIPAGRTRTLNDMAWCVAHLNADPHKIAFRLQLLGSSDPGVPLELPAFYIDALVLDALVATPSLINHDPESDETNVPITTTIGVDIIDTGPDGIALAGAQVYVNGVLAFDSGAFQTGFSGSHTAPQADTLRLLIDHAVAFTSEELVTVRVVAVTNGGRPIDTSYSFTTADVLPPVVVSAASVAEKTVRVLFNEPMNQASAVVPSAYAFARAPGAIAVPIHAVAVVAITDTIFEVTLDTEITPNVVYTVTVTGASDVAGNVIAAPNNTASFVGYACPKPDDREWDLYEFLPQMNRSEDEGDLARFIAVFQELCDLILCKVDRFTDIIDPDIAEIRFVEAMLDDLGNPFRFSLSDTDKRRLVQVLVAIYKAKGTAQGIIDAIRFFLAIDVTITAPAVAPLGLGDWSLGFDWVLGSGVEADLYTFWINAPALTEAQRDRIFEIADYMKAAHEHFKIVEPPPPPEVIDHLELSLSRLGVDWLLH